MPPKPRRKGKKMRRPYYLIFACMAVVMGLTGCGSTDKIDTALLLDTPVTVNCYSDYTYYNSEQHEETIVLEDYIFTGYPEDLEILEDTPEDGKITATAVISNAYYFTADSVKITYTYGVENNKIVIYSAAAEKNTVAICVMQELSTEIFFERDEPLILEYDGREIPITKDYISSIEFVTNAPYPCRYGTHETNVNYQGEVHFADYEGITYCVVVKANFPPITRKTSIADPEYTKPPGWKVEWYDYPSATIVDTDHKGG